MKAEFELQIDPDGNPIICFRHHDKDGSIDQKLLAKFVEKALKNGLQIKPNGYYDARSQGMTYNRYIISPK